ncbi:unnamed protein product [Parnassius apollo]|uniref:(apollo) hypothetical protein n=1 Tax=Parnassius apollo TaxID=110799 RepID=A0A8S3XEJ8_PARAO|nr:unnamed protein product [Parnassius apollo]
MDLRNQEEQISKWLEEVEDKDEGSNDSASETEDNVEEAIHINTSDSEFSNESSEPEDDIIRPSKRQRTQIVDSDDSLEDIHETNSPQTSIQGNQRVLQVTPRFLYGKNKHKWSSVPRSATTRTLRRNIVHFIPGPRGEARELQEPIDLFRLFMTDDMLQQVVTFTNAEIITQRNRYKQESYTVSQTNLLEIKALLGLLLIAAAMKSNHLPTRILFNPQRSGTIFEACMSAERFNFLIKFSINAYAIYVSNDLRNKKKPTLRRHFVMKMGDQLMDPWLRERLQTVTLRRNIKVMIKDILGESSEPELPVHSVTNVRKICYLCPSNDDLG